MTKMAQDHYDVGLVMVLTLKMSNFLYFLPTRWPLYCIETYIHFHVLRTQLELKHLLVCCKFIQCTLFCVIFTHTIVCICIFILHISELQFEWFRMMVNVCNKYYKKYQQHKHVKSMIVTVRLTENKIKKKISYYFIVLHFKLKMSLYFAFATL